jgi:hypothetical protein
MIHPIRGLRHVILAALLFAAPLAAQGTAPVPLDDPAYVYLDRLEELGVVRSAVMGQRPYSYREMGRLIAAARVAASREGPSARERALVDELLTRLEARTPQRVPALSALLDDGIVTAHVSDAVRRALPAAATANPPHATSDPLALRRLGEPAPRGQSIAAEALQRAEPASFLAFNGREREEGGHGIEGEPSTHSAELLEAGGRVRWRNLALMAGREQIGWGSGGAGGLFIASDAPALDQLSLASDHPFLLPSVLRRIGPVFATLVLAELGPATVRSHSELLAYKVSVRPTPNLEVGGTFENHFGGEGGRSSSLGDRLIDFLPMIDLFRKHNYFDSTQTLEVDSDKALGADVRWRIDRLGGVIVAGEWLVDDFDVHRLRSLFNYDGSHALSIIIPRLASPAWSLRLGATHMGPLTYAHAALTQGMTTRGRLLGNELGPDAKAFWAEGRWMPSASIWMSLAGESAISSNAIYSLGFDPADPAKLLFVRKLSAAPDELREQAVGTLVLAPSAAAGVLLRAGAVRIRNAMFTGGRRHDYVADIALRLRP